MTGGLAAAKAGSGGQSQPAQIYMAAKAESGPKGRAARVGSATSDSTNTFIYGTVTQSPLLSLCWPNKGAKAETPKGQVCS
jgi:hypothetical protein